LHLIDDFGGATAAESLDDRRAGQRQGLDVESYGSLPSAT